MEEKKKNDPKKSQKKLNNYVKYSSIAFQMIITLLLGVFGGIKLDEWVKWEFPVFTVVLSLVAVFLALYYAVKDFLKF